MIISRRKYEQALNEAREEGYRKAEERFYQERRYQGVLDRMERLARRIGKLEGPHECRCGSNEKHAMPEYPFED